MNSHFLIFLSILALAFVGCGGGTPESNNGANNGTNNGTNDGTVGPNNGTNNETNNGTTIVTCDTNTGEGTLDEFADSYQMAICHIAFNCTGRLSRRFRRIIASRFATEAECSAGGFFGSLFEDFAKSEAGVAAGRLQLDSDALAVCVVAFRSSGCDAGEFGAEPEECGRIFTGLVAEGDVCALNEECSTGLQCQGSANSCTGRCKVIPPSCGNLDCADGEFCNNDVCTRIFNLGETCQSDEQCTGLDAVRDTARAGCFNGECTAFGSLANGEDCGRQIEFCIHDSFCNDQDQCEAFNTLTNGEACNFNEVEDCEAGTVCSDLSLQTLTGTCEPAKASGEECTFFPQCQWGLHCFGADFQAGTRGTCMPALGDGEACESDEQCDSFHCDDGQTCGEPVACIP